MGIPVPLPTSKETLGDRVIFVRESLLKSQLITDNMVSILGSFDHRLSSLETAMRPTQIRMHSIRRAHENIDRTLKSTQNVLEQFDIARKAEAKVLRGPHEDLESYLEAIEQLKYVLMFLSGNKSFKHDNEALNRVHNLVQKAISKLEDEFRQILMSYSKPIEPDCLFDCLPNSLRPNSTQGDAEQSKSAENFTYKPLDLVPPRVLPLLHNLVIQMIQAGYQQQVLSIYRETRSTVMEITLRKLGVERLTKEDVQKMQWEALEAKIGNWIHYMRISVKLLFSGEKKVSDEIFKSIESIRILCFAEVTSSCVSSLLSFGDAIARSKRSPEKLFVLLDMYEIMRELQPEIERIFEGRPCTEMRESAASLTKRLAQTAQETFGDFEEAVEKDATKTIVMDGTVHPLTSYVINYVKFLFDYQSTLKQLFQEFSAEDPGAQLAALTTRIMQALQINLDGKSKQYKDCALTQLFLMNNIHYIVRSVRRSDAKDLLGDDWVQRHRRIVQQHANQYKRVSWSKILQFLSVQPAGSTGSAATPDAAPPLPRAMVKERFKNFNLQFEELHQRQSQWTVPDSELRESLRLAVAEVLLPAYRNFFKRYGPMIESGKNPQKYIRFSAEELERMLNEFFEGKNWGDQKR
ncbi:exocyst complex component EXO70A1-like [Amaranthus tricolor]|uniref:exocyst complex component EXO70A1-like n=1 Tax=Amaranthus tricolor TaxID=29722 RepID=UPI00258F4970|nr:exocyst complex component EXO70A1-like [Amaranthus tricolor]